MTDSPLRGKEAERWDAAEEGAEFLRDGAPDEARALLEEVIRADSGNVHAVFRLGDVHFACEAWERALKAYLLAIDLAPDHLGAMVGAGHALRMMRKLEQAIRMGHQVLQRKKNDGDALYLLGLAHYQRGDKAQAAEFLRLFLKTRPELEVSLEVEGLLQIIAGAAVQPLDEQEDD